MQLNVKFLSVLALILVLLAELAVVYRHKRPGFPSSRLPV